MNTSADSESGATGGPFSPGIGHGSTSKEFLVALRNWATVLGYLMLRHFDKKSTAGRFSVLLTFAEPFILLGSLFLIRTVIRTMIFIYGESLILFFASGVLPFYMFSRTAVYAKQTQLKPQQPLPRITAMDAFIAGSVVNAVIWVFAIAIAFWVLWLWGIDQARPVHIEQCLEALLLLFLVGTGVGLINSAIGRVFPFYFFIAGMAMRGIMFFSGVIHIAAFYRVSIREWLVWNPMMHGVEWFRLGLYGRYPTLALDRPYLIKCAIVLLFIGLVADRATLRYAGR